MIERGPDFCGNFAITHTDIYKIRIDLHWTPDGSWMWYRNDLAKGEREFILVDLQKGLRQRAFEHDKAATALRETGAGEVGEAHSSSSSFTPSL